MYFYIIKDGELLPTDELSDFMFQEGWRFSHFDKSIKPYQVEDTKNEFRNQQFN